MACSTPPKVPVKITGFSEKCMQINDGTGTPAAVTLGGILSTGSVGSFYATQIAALAHKCINIACPPTIILEDNLTTLLAFVEGQTTIKTDYRQSAVTELDDTAVRYGIARLISCVGCCC